MAKTLYIVCIFFVFSVFFMPLSAQVNRPELESTGLGENLRFINYAGPNAVINSAAQITAIGSNLGQTIAALPQGQTGTAGTENRYYVAHTVTEQNPEKLNADIFSLGIDVGVDHVRNLRFILAGYLSAAYGYNEQDAQTLAVYITVYNAVYRGNMQVFQQRYKPQVVQSLTPQSAGLSTNFADWPGATRMIIPLGAVEGALSPIDTSVISDKQVVETLKKEPDMAVPVRNALADLKERESQAATESAQSAAQSAAAAQQAATAAQQAAVVSQQAAVVAQQAATSAQQNAAQNPQDPTAQEQAKATQNAAMTAQTTAIETQQAAVQTQQQANETAQTATIQQTLADKKRAEAQNERADIAKDTNMVQNMEAAAAQITAVPALKLTDAKKNLSSIVLINTETGKVLNESPINVIRSRTLLAVTGGFVAIAGTNGRNSAVRLIFIDGKTLEMSTQSFETVAEDAVLVQGSDGMFYTIIENGRKYSLAKYNSQMILQARSDIFVYAQTPITLTEKAVIVTDDQNAVQYVRQDTLTVF